MNLAKFLTITCLKEHLRWLLLKISYTTFLGIVITISLDATQKTACCGWKSNDVAFCIPQP